MLLRVLLYTEFYDKNKQQLSYDYGKLEKLNQLLISTVAYKRD